MEGAAFSYAQPAGQEEAAESAVARSRLAGPPAAMMVSVGFASLVLGVLSTLTAMSASVSNVLTFSERVGDLSGVTTVASLVFLGGWAGLAFSWRKADLSLKRVAILTAALLALALVGTFPPFFQALGK
jgi:uncharacterized membrane protein YozB (DUF420 family)